MLKSFCIVFAIFSSTFVFSHSGGLDSQGGHKKKSDNTYHCHREGCYTQLKDKKIAEQFQNIEIEAQKAKAEGRAFSALYSRKDWPHWIDEDGDCQNTRSEILIKASLQAVKFKRNKMCNVSHGKWFDPYTGKTFYKASDLDVDHIIPLSWAHKHGAANWNREKKRAFANDQENLIPVADYVNREKGGKGPRLWLPPNKTYQKEYLEHFEKIAQKYELQ